MPRVVLFQPQIPPNTGNVARTCAATGVELHLVDPLGFEISDRSLKRAGLDYWPWVPLQRHPNWQAFVEHQRQLGGRLLALSRHASDSYLTCDFQADDWLLFGRETDGLPSSALEACDGRLMIPMRCSSDRAEGGVRSLNLSVSVGIVLFEALRQLGQLSPSSQ